MNKKRPSSSLPKMATTFFAAFAATIALILSAMLAAPPAMAAGSQISTDKEIYTVGDRITVTYETDTPFAKNWVSIYHENKTSAPGQGLTDGWVYTPSTNGTIQIHTDGTNPQCAPGSTGQCSEGKVLTPGRYKLHLLENDGYSSLAGPIWINLVAPSTQSNLSAVVSNYTAQDGRVNEQYKVKASSFFYAPTSVGPISYELTSGPGWLTLNDGVLSGTPAAAGDAQAVVTAKLGNETKTVTLTFPIKAEYEPLGDEFKVLTYNTWSGGSPFRNTNLRELEKELFLGQEADAIAIQETNANHANQLAADLGWDVQVSQNCQTNGAWCAVLSRYPLVDQDNSNASVGALVEIDRVFDRQVWVYSSHLAPYPYGPYEARDHGAQAALNAETSSKRVAEINSAIAGMNTTVPQGSDTPVIFAGDMNAPSHLDWTEAAKANHFGLVVPWPVSTRLEEEGFIDTFRTIFPDPLTHPANSWSPRDTQDVQDRIDFIYQRGDGIEIVAAEYLDGGNLSRWTSDHGAFTTTFAFADIPEAATAADLVSLSVNGEAIAKFAADATAYAVELPAGTTQLPIVAAAAADAHSTVTINQATALPGNATVKVISPRGTLERNYTVSFTVAKAPVNPTEPKPVQPIKPVVPAKANSTLKVKVLKKKVKATKRAKIRVTLKAAGVTNPTGKVRIIVKAKIGKKSTKRVITKRITAKNKGKITVKLPKLKKAGKYKITAKFAGSTKIKVSKTKKPVRLRVIK